MSKFFVYLNALLIACACRAGNITLWDATNLYSVSSGATNIVPFASLDALASATNNCLDEANDYTDSATNGAVAIFTDWIGTNSLASRDWVSDQIAAASELTLHGATNSHPTMTADGSLWVSTPETAWSIATVTAEGTNRVGTYWYTNKTDLIRHGMYSGMFYVGRTAGNGQVAGYIELIYSDDDGATTNVLDTSGASAQITATTSYRLTCNNESDISDATTNLWLGVSYYLVRVGAVAATITTYGGQPYDTHLETPGIGVVGSLVHEAPVDGTSYGRKDGAWSAVVATETDPQWEIWRTNSAAGSTNCILPDGSLTDVSALFGGGGDASGWSGYAATNPVYLDGNSIIGNGTLNIQGSTNAAQGLAWKTVFIADEGASLYAGMGADGSFIQVGSGGTVLSPCFQFGQSRSDSVLWPVYHGDDKIAESGTLYSAGSPVLTAETDPQWEIWRTNSAAGTTNAILPDGSLVDVSTLFGGGAETDPVAATNNVKKSDTNGWYVASEGPYCLMTMTPNQTNATASVLYPYRLDAEIYDTSNIWDPTNYIGTFGRTGLWALAAHGSTINLSPGYRAEIYITLLEHGGSYTNYRCLARAYKEYMIEGFHFFLSTPMVLYDCTNAADQFRFEVLDNDPATRNCYWVGGGTPAGRFGSAAWLHY